MADKKGDGDKKNESQTGDSQDKYPGNAEDELRELCESEVTLPGEETSALGRIAEEVEAAEENVSSSDAADEDLEEEYHKLNDILDLPEDTHSLTNIKLSLPSCVKYGVRSGTINLKHPKFSPLSRGLQGPAIAIAAFATNSVLKSRCWNELIIDQIIDDGDTYYCESYKSIKTDDRRKLTALDLKREFAVQNSHYVHVDIDDPAYAGTFRSQNPKEMHFIKALELFFERYDAGLLTSSRLNMAIWRDSKFFNIFDGQGRGEDCSPMKDRERGAAKLILVRDLIGVAFIVLEKSQVENESFLIFDISVTSTQKLSLAVDDPEEPYKSIGRPKRRPSGYKIQEQFRALIQGSYHLKHSRIPEELRGRSHLLISIAALIYSRLVNANKWSSVLVDLIFNQAHIYMIDLVRVLEKKLDDTLELKIDDLMSDVILGVYAAKVKVQTNVVPGQGKKGKSTIDTGIREFFRNNLSGILEIKKTFYPIWKESNKYYLLDPFACDNEGFRVDPTDPEDAVKYKSAVACVTMNSSINQLVETILENTGNKEKDPFIVHGIRILYVKTGTVPGGPLDNVIYREKKTNRRPLAPVNGTPELNDTSDEINCKAVIDMTPKPRPDAEKTKNEETQFPELMAGVEDYMMKEEEPRSFVESHQQMDLNTQTAPSLTWTSPSSKEDVTGKETDEETFENENPVIDGKHSKQEVQYIEGYKIVNPHRLVLQGSKNCLAEEFVERSRGKQGLVIALTAMAYGKIKHPSEWRNIDVNQIIDVGDKAYGDIINWIRKGRPQEANAEDEEDEEEQEDEEDDDLPEKGQEEGSDESEDDNEKDSGPTRKGLLQSVPSNLDVSMLPERLKLGENTMFFKNKLNVAEGDANPLVNLGESLEHYLSDFNELVVENKKLMYGLWKDDTKYYLFNPYGSDEEGWRTRERPGCFMVTDTINELTDAFYGVLEFNDPKFKLHFIGIESIQPNDKYISPKIVESPTDDFAKNYRIIFLPVTDDDLYLLEPEPELEPPEPAAETKDGDGEQSEEEEEEQEKEERENEPTKEDINQTQEEVQPQTEKPIIDPLQEVEEVQQPDAPEELNLSLLTGNVKIEEDHSQIGEENDETEILEKLKLNHPPPYVLPPKKVLCLLLDAKRASKSAHSLLSRFSIDSKLAVKQENDLPTGKTVQPVITTVNASSESKTSKLIKLPPKKYFVSRIPPTGFTPIRAINDKFMQDEDLDKAREEECENRKMKEVVEDVAFEEVPEVPTGVRIKPCIIPLGPTIKTPTPKRKPKPCPEKKIRKCKLTEKEKEDPVLDKLMCNTEDLILNMIFPDLDANVKENKEPQKKKDPRDEVQTNTKSHVRMKDPKEKPKHPPNPETCGFKMTDEEIGVIEGNMCLENRAQVELCHFKQCYFTAILCILAKVKTNVDHFRGTILDQFILAGDKIYQHTGKLRYKPLRWFHNIEALGTKCNIILKQVTYADPENCREELLSEVLSNYFEKYQTGILVFSNAAYAFWFSKGKYHLFDPYACDETGLANADGFACLMQFPDLDSLIARIRENTGETSGKPYRIHSLAIAHMELLKRAKRKTKIRICPEREPSEDSVPVEPEPVLSLIELVEWVTRERKDNNKVPDMALPGFSPVPNYSASTLEVIVLENDITNPILTEFKKVQKNEEGEEAVRRKPYDRTFKEHTSISEPIDLCLMAWSCVHDPIHWGTRTIKGLYEASSDFAHDSLLAWEDSTSDGMTDGILPEFTVANYTFRVAFAPFHYGTLYATKGWNLAMSLEKVLSSPVYSGALLLCGKAHVGVMKRRGNYYAWWVLPRTKHLRIITSEEMEDFLKLIVKKINEPDEIKFSMRAVTISYAQKVAPDCEDTAGLHEKVIPTTSLAEIHKKKAPAYDIDAIFRKISHHPKPVFVLGTVALRNRDALREPRMKRCYFVAVLALMVKRDILQSTVSGTIDKVIEVAEGLYREFHEPKYHTEHILRNVTVMNRIFDLRDCASPLVVFRENPGTGRNEDLARVKKHLRKHFRKHSDGIIHFTNCSYGFWYSRSTSSYYYLDPYQCNDKGKKVSNGGLSCLCIFPSLCHMVKHMYQNRFDNTTGFFIHRLHVETINVPHFKSLKEDPMWVYLDFHWSFSHAPNVLKPGKKRKEKAINQEKPSWNHYAIEVPNLIYSVWGTLGCYDPRFGARAGKTQAAICVAVLAMHHLCHPSRWGPAILDSAVICGDCYYTESLRSAARTGCKHPNRFNLQPCFKVFPHVWAIEFKENMCGILYGTRDRLSLAATLKLAFEEAPNVIIECNKITFSILSVDDGYYVADSRWTGPPLFSKNRGALYVLRCKDMSSLIYALTKMLNTNQKLEFHVTPISLTFSQESCKLGGDKTRVPQKKILLDPLSSHPGRACDLGSSIPGALVAPDEDTYLWYRRNLARGIEHGDELENPKRKSAEYIPAENLTSTLISTNWHLNAGRPMRRKRTKQAFIGNGTGAGTLSNGWNIGRTLPAISDGVQVHDYPRIIDFVDTVDQQPTDTSDQVTPVVTVHKPIACSEAQSFLLNRSREKFNKMTEQMADKWYKEYEHRVPTERRESKIEKVEGVGEGVEFKSPDSVSKSEEYGVDSSVND